MKVYKYSSFHLAIPSNINLLNIVISTLYFYTMMSYSKKNLNPGLLQCILQAAVELRELCG
jgi:hypothetical protein